jgi:hypothetical protein
VQRLQHADELLAEAVLEGDPLGLDPPRDQQHLLVLHVHALHRADPGREVEHLRLAERRSGVPAAADLPDHRGVQAFLDGGPDREGRGEVVAVDDQVRAVPHADLVDLAEQRVGGVTGEHVREAGLNTHADQGELAAVLPLRRQRELVVAELDPGRAVRVVRVRMGQRHRHVEIVNSGSERSRVQRHDESRICRVHQDVARMIGEQPGDGVGVPRVDPDRPVPVASRRGTFRPAQVVVADDEVGERPAGGDPRERGADAAGTNEKYPHLRDPISRISAH